MNSSNFSMRSLRWFALALAAVACVFYAIYLGHAIYVERALYADGSFFFVDLLSNDSGWPVSDDQKHIRYTGRAECISRIEPKRFACRLIDSVLRLVG